jgi:hypothetical protein
MRHKEEDKKDATMLPRTKKWGNWSKRLKANKERGKGSK